MCGARAIVLALIVSVSVAFATDEWSVDDILLAENAGSFAVSPDGEWAVWVKTRMDKEKGERVSNLFLSSLDGKTEVQLTQGKNSHREPAWSPDGTYIAFLSDRPLPEDVKKKEDLAKTQLWLMRAEGGEPWMLSKLERGLKAFAWKDNDTLVFTAQESRSLYEHEVKERKDTSQAVEDTEHEPPVRVFSIAREGGKVARVTDNRDWIDLMSVSPDGKWAVTNHRQSLSFDFDQKVKPQIFLTNLETGERTRLFSDNAFVLSTVTWALDCRAFYFVVRYSTHPTYTMATVGRVYYYALGAKDAVEVDLRWDKYVGERDVTATQDGFVTLLADGVRFKPLRYRKDGAKWTRSFIGGRHAGQIFDWAVSRNGRDLVYETSTASTPPRWYGAELRGGSLGGLHQLAKLDPEREKKPMHKTEVVQWTGANGDEVEGIVYYPLNYEAGKRYPLLLSIHGGPAGTDFDRWGQSWGSPMVLLAQKGIMQLKVNYHGSTNYGLEWVESIGGGHYYDLPLQDIEAGVDYLIARGLADPDKLATMGWSNGSIYSIALSAKDPRYKAVSAGAGDVEWISDWGNVDFGAAFDNYYFGGSPWDNTKWYLENSPFFELDKVTAPTIIYFGADDRNVPPSQGWSHFRALQQFGNAKVKFLLFPGEPHGPQKYVHQKRKVEEELAWFDRYLLGNNDAENPALKEGSPLDVAVTLNGVAKVDGKYGRMINGVLAPETVEYKGAVIGRFEVTRAQFAQFDPAYSFAPGTENYPANGVTFERAKAYAEWLAGKTGQAFRLGKKADLEKLYSETNGENTLDYWAGYAPNPEDATRLAEEAAKLGGDAPLLREVGKFAARGEDPVFDIGGNAAEWSIGENGEGMLVGGSADRPADRGWERELAGAGYRGMRVVVTRE